MKQFLLRSLPLVALASLVGGCASYDYLQHADRVSYHAGNAVRANLERETLNPSSDTMYDTSGLGKNGSVMPVEKPATTSPETAKQPATDSTTATSPL